MMIRLRSFKTKKVQQKKELVSNDDDVPWFLAATFGLKVGSTLLGARKQSKASKAQIGANEEAIRDINLALGGLDETAIRRVESAEFDTTNAIGDMASTVSRGMDDISKQSDSLVGKQGFSFAGETNEQISSITERMQEEFLTKHTGALRALDKTTADIESWRNDEEMRLKRDRRKLQLENRRLRQTNSTWKALGF